jgi:PDZ domain
MSLRNGQKRIRSGSEGRERLVKPNMQTGTDGAEVRATILRLPEIKIGSLSLKQVGALGIAPEAPPIPPAPGQSKVEGHFFDWYSRKTPEPVIGWLGGNVLRGFRLMIDFPGRTSYWERVSDLDPNDLDQVGVTLEKRSDGYFIAGIAEKAGKPTVDAVRVGDKLIQVDGVLLSEATRGAIFAALHGDPGSVRMLVLDRDGRQLTLPAKVTAF